jgi:hypothetical protein
MLFSQVTKWLMSKGQVLTWTTYDTLLLALLMDKRVDEAESVWNTVIQTHTRSVPKRLFSRMILIYDIHQRPDKVLEVYLTHLHLLVGLSDVNPASPSLAVVEFAAQYWLSLYPNYIR